MKETWDGPPPGGPHPGFPLEEASAVSKQETTQASSKEETPPPHPSL